MKKNSVSSETTELLNKIADQVSRYDKEPFIFSTDKDKLLSYKKDLLGICTRLKSIDPKAGVLQPLDSSSDYEDPSSRIPSLQYAQADTLIDWIDNILKRAE